MYQFIDGVIALMQQLKFGGVSMFTMILIGVGIMAAVGVLGYFINKANS